MQFIRMILAALLSVLLPSTGCHRTTVKDTPCTPAAPPTEAPVTRPAPVTGPIARGEDIGVVRPYLVAFEREQREEQVRRSREQARRQTLRRTLWLAPRGVDLASLVRHDFRTAT